LSEPSKDGLDAAWACGRKGGRHSIMTAEKYAAAVQMHDSKRYTIEQIANAVGVSRTTLYRYPGQNAAPVALPLEYP
jgi:DNA invertase Pin-like site-specific DNA recombinase